MFSYIDKKLNSVTMYRLMLYYLFALLAWAIILGLFGVLSYSPLTLIISTLYIGIISWLVNIFFSRIYKVPTNNESFYITAFILVLIITPPQSIFDTSYYYLAGFAALLAMASKYILAVRKKHVFNPAAISVVITSFVLGQSASWWVGTSWMLLPTLLGGFLMIRKLQRSDLAFSFFVVAIISASALSFFDFNILLLIVNSMILSSPLFFFAFVMLTEPQTTPPTRRLRVLYGVIVGFLYSSSLHIGTLYFTPEIALVAGNIFSFIVSPKEKLVLTLKEIKKIANDTYDFVFIPGRRFSWRPGEYLEWTLDGKGSDDRGNRRYFTIASSPTEEDVRLGIKFYPNPSSFKRKFMSMKKGEIALAGGRAGDFTLPKDINKKLVFIAGGIGITPFRSMLKYLLDRSERRDIELYYSNKTIDDIAYRDILEKSHQDFGMRVVYVLTDTELIPASWRGEKGFIDREMIKRNTPDYLEREFYLSGPHSMVVAYERVLASMGVKKLHIKKDFFPGYA